MIIENVEVAGFKAAIRGMRNPMDSWDLSDSQDDVIGKNDLRLMKQLSAAGDDHSKFLRMITVWMDIKAPIFWWSQFDTYKVGTVANSCSKMHKMGSRLLTIDDFTASSATRANLRGTINHLNVLIKDWQEDKSKNKWRTIIEELPMCYNQKRTVMLNYAVLKNMYHSRKNHKLEEWRWFCSKLEDNSLFPYFYDICGDV